MQNRRMFLGSAVAAGVGLAVGRGTLVSLPVAAQDARMGAGADPVAQELIRQVRKGMQKLLNGEGEGARQMASTLRVWAAHLRRDEATWSALLRESIKQKGRHAIVSATPNHDEMKKIAQDIGFPVHLLPPHTAPDAFLREQALNQLLKEGLTPSMGRAANILDEVSMEFDERRGQVRRVARQTYEPCEWTCGTAENAKDIMEAVCAVAAIAVWIPGGQAAAASACLAATTAWLTAMAACQLCKIGMAL